MRKSRKEIEIEFRLLNCITPIGLRSAEKLYETIANALEKYAFLEKVLDEYAEKCPKCGKPISTRENFNEVKNEYTCSNCGYIMPAGVD